MFVGDGSQIHVVKTGTTNLGLNPFCAPVLNNVLITAQIIKNLVSFRKLTRDNKCSIEFEDFGFSVNGFLTKQVLIQCDSIEDLYLVTSPTPQALLSVTPSTWHQLLVIPIIKLSSF